MVQFLKSSDNCPFAFHSVPWVISIHCELNPLNKMHKEFIQRVPLVQIYASARRCDYQAQTFASEFDNDQAGGRQPQAAASIERAQATIEFVASTGAIR